MKKCGLSTGELYRMKQVCHSKETGFREINNGYNNPFYFMAMLAFLAILPTLTATTQEY